jgi:hypothetical protein
LSERRIGLWREDGGGRVVLGVRCDRVCCSGCCVGPTCWRQDPSVGRLYS